MFLGNAVPIIIIAEWCRKYLELASRGDWFHLPTMMMTTMTMMSQLADIHDHAGRKSELGLRDSWLLIKADRINRFLTTTALGSTSIEILSRLSNLPVVTPRLELPSFPLPLVLRLRCFLMLTSFYSPPFSLFFRHLFRPLLLLQLLLLRFLSFSLET